MVAVLLFTIPAFSQDLSRKEMKKLVKELKREEKAKELARKSVMVKMMMDQRRFVLEADQLRDSRGRTSMVSSTINFIGLDSRIGVIQIGNDRYIGLNGLGGITLEGPISNFESTYREKKGTHYVQYDLRTSSGTYFVSMNVAADGRASATVSSNWPGKITYTGDLVPPEASRVYKGSRY
jgi:hypothetical protein